MSVKPKTRVVMELIEGQSRAVINGGEITVKVLEKTGRHRVRLVFEMDAAAKVNKEYEGDKPKCLTD